MNQEFNSVEGGFKKYETRIQFRGRVVRRIGFENSSGMYV